MEINNFNNLRPALTKLTRNYFKIGDYIKTFSNDIYKVKSLCYDIVYLDPNGFIKKSEIECVVTVLDINCDKCGENPQVKDLLCNECFYEEHKQTGF